MNGRKKMSTITLLVAVPRGQCTNTVAAVRSILRLSGDFYQMPVKVSTLHGKEVVQRAQSSLGPRALRAMERTAKVLEEAADAIDNATWGAVADEERQHPIAKDWRKAERACRAEAKRIRTAIQKATRSMP